MTIVLGLAQHRAQITAEWLNTDSGEVSHARVTPAHRGGVRRFFGRFAGEDLEVALEATTGWRFVVEELQAIGADVHLAEPAETSSCAGARSGPRPTAPTPGTCAGYEQAAARLGGNRACLAVARKLLKRSYHTLRELGDEALQPA